VTLQRWVKNLSLFSKLLLLSLLFSLPTLLVVSLLLSQRVRSNLERQVGAQLQELAFQTSDKLDRNLFERYGDVQVFALSSAAQNMDPSSIKDWMNTVVQAYSPMYSLMVVADLGGKIIAFNTRDGQGKAIDSDKILRLLGRNVSGETWFKAAVGGRVELGKSLVEGLHRDGLLETVYGPSRALALSFTAAIRNAQGDVVGVWTNRFEWAAGQAILRQAEARAQESGAKSVHVSMFDPQARVLDSSDQGRILSDTFKVQSAAIARGIQPSGYGAGRSFQDGTVAALEGWARSTGYSSFPGLNWTVAASQDRAEVDAQVSSFTVSLLVLLLALLVAVLLAAWLISRYVTGRVKRMATLARGLAVGDLEQNLNDDSKDELGGLARSFEELVAHQRRMAQVAQAMGRGELDHAFGVASERDALGHAFVDMSLELRGMVLELRGGAQNLRVASQQLLSQASAQASSVSQQSAAVAQTTATIEQVKASADQAVDMAATVNTNAQSANRVALGGVETVRTAEGSMGDIKERVSTIAENILSLSEQTQQIDDIISTVGDLADQSNLLALNAAIEASRAGEHGRGFAVVAQEIRVLAEQSKAATAQIRTILSDIQKATNVAVLSTEQGIRVAEGGAVSMSKVGRTLDELNEAIGQSAYSAQMIAASVRQHSIGMEQVAVAMGDINSAVSGTQRASVQTRAAAQELSVLAEKLTELVARYRV